MGVVQPKLRRPLELTSLYDDLTRAGRTPTTEVLSFEPVEAHDEIAERLEVAEGTAVHESCESGALTAKRSPF